MHRTDIQVRFGDTDALGHLNNASYASYTEIARLNFLHALGIPTMSLILAHLALDFRRQVRFGEPVHVESRVAMIGRSSVTLVQLVMASGVLAVEGKSVVVHFDYATQQPQAFPDTLRTLLEASMTSALHGGASVHSR